MSINTHKLVEMHVCVCQSNPYSDNGELLSEGPSLGMNTLASYRL